MVIVIQAAMASGLDASACSVGDGECSFTRIDHLIDVKFGDFRYCTSATIRAIARKMLKSGWPFYTLPLSEKLLPSL